MLRNPSPRIKPDAMMINGVVDCFRTLSQYQLTIPPMARASVNEGTLYMPTATAMPPGIQERHGLPTDRVRARVVTAKRTPAPVAHSLAISGKPCPVTSLAVKIQT